ncbi:hypothetical protein BA768_04805 [Chryseobacterium sp. CBo1]|uniref:hypothetical protein n=1 Tax=Chryseobacterium sp. CBo1 TaxID=1869230 RepID=UPI000810353D|nr:hypothetical protein [Chryseobacterium sp. CBo1]OCK50475.1 hypothetical protein BA768_04805 [Chryseobacterium sp. CBo1]
MLTDQEMLEIAERFMKRIVDKETEAVILHEETIKKPYGNIYFFQAKEFLLTRDFNKVLTNNPPFLVEKEKGRVVNLGPLRRLEYEIQAYENGTMKPTMDLYWYPDEDRFSRE